MFKEILEEIKNQINNGQIWYGRYPAKNEDEVGIWLEMSSDDLPEHWEYKCSDSDVVFRRDEE